MDSSKLKKPEHKHTLRHRSTKYLERLQKVMDAANTATNSQQLRNKFIERQNRMNYRNEFDRLRGALSHLGDDKLIREEIQKMVGTLGENKLRAIGQYQEEKEPEPAPAAAAGPASVTNQHLHIHQAPPQPEPKAKAQAKAGSRSRATSRPPADRQPTVRRGPGTVPIP